MTAETLNLLLLIGIFLATLIVGYILFNQNRYQQQRIKDQSEQIKEMRDYYENIQELRAESDYRTIEKELNKWEDGFLTEVSNKFTELYAFIFDIIIQLPKEKRLTFIEERFPTSKVYFLQSLIQNGYIDSDNTDTPLDQPNQNPKGA